MTIKQVYAVIAILTVLAVALFILGMRIYGSGSALMGM